MVFSDWFAAVNSLIGMMRLSGSVSSAWAWAARNPRSKRTWRAMAGVRATLGHQPQSALARLRKSSGPCDLLFLLVPKGFAFVGKFLELAIEEKTDVAGIEPAVPFGTLASHASIIGRSAIHPLSLYTSGGRNLFWLSPSSSLRPCYSLRRSASPRPATAATPALAP